MGFHKPILGPASRLIITATKSPTVFFSGSKQWQVDQHLIEWNYSENILKVVYFALRVLPPPPPPLQKTNRTLNEGSHRANILYCNRQNISSFKIQIYTFKIQRRIFR
jgi:hypothetical protein